MSKKYKSNINAYIAILISYIIEISIANMFSCFFYASEQMRWFTNIFPAFRFFDFMIGCNLGYIYLNFRNRKMTKIKATCIEVTTFIITFSSIYMYMEKFALFGNDIYRYAILFVPTSVLLVLCFAYTKGYITQFLNNKYLQGLGDLSAYTYIIHQIVFR